MSRSGYSDDYDDNGTANLYRGSIERALRGKRGQSFLREMLAALDALPEHKLIADWLEVDGAVCAIGAVGKARGIDMSRIDPEDPDGVSAAFGIAPSMAREIVYMNDEYFEYRQGLTPEARWTAMREWVASQLRDEQPTTAA